MPQPEQLAARAAAQGRLWANVFGCMMEEGRYEVGGAGGWQCGRWCVHCLCGCVGVW